MKIAPVSGTLLLELAIGVAVIGAAWYAMSKASSAIVDTAAAGAQVLDNGVSSVVTGIGSAVGIPQTNESDCAQLLREGRTWDASFACPAKTFLSYLAGNHPEQDYTWQAHGAR